MASQGPGATSRGCCHLGAGGISRGWCHLGGLVPPRGDWCHLTGLVPPHGAGSAPTWWSSPPKLLPCPQPRALFSSMPTDMAFLFVTMLWLAACHYIPGMFSHDMWGAPQPEFPFARWILEVSRTKRMDLWLPHSDPLPPQTLESPLAANIHTRRVLSSALLRAGLLPRGSAW